MQKNDLSCLIYFPKRTNLKAQIIPNTIERTNVDLCTVRKKAQ